VLRRTDIFVQGSMFDLMGSVCWLLFLLFVTLSQLRSVLKQREVTGEPYPGGLDLPLARLYLDVPVRHHLSLASGLLWGALHSQNQTIRSRFGIYFRFWAISA
jgi:hypothetical protein